jgi:hypothetical protein
MRVPVNAPARRNGRLLLDDVFAHRRKPGGALALLLPQDFDLFSVSARSLDRENGMLGDRAGLST